MTGTQVPPVLVTGATGRVGRAVVDQLVAAGVPVRALTHRPEATTLPGCVEVVTGDLTVPESLDAGLRGVSAVFLVWTVPTATASAVIDRFATHTRRVVRWPYGAAETAPIDDRNVAAVVARTLCESGHAGGDYVLTGPESLSHAQQVSIIGDVVERRIRFDELSPDDFRRQTAGSWPPPVVDMLLAAWGATLGRPALVTSAVSDILGSAPRSYRQWVADHATAFIADLAPAG